MKRFGKSNEFSVRVRPKFEITSKLNRDEFSARILAQKAVNTFRLMNYQSHSVLRIREQDQHYWSPELQLTFSQHEDEMIVRGRYQPHPNVWTLFTLLYLASILTLLAILLIGLTKISLGISTNALLLSLFPSSTIFGLYFSSRIGQRLGHDQTEYLHEIIEKAMDTEIPMM